MTKSPSRAVCMENAMLLFSIVRALEPMRHMSLETCQYQIELKIFFEKDERESLDMMDNILSVYKMEWADYTENYYEENEFYCIRNKWDIIK